PLRVQDARVQAEIEDGGSTAKLALIAPLVGERTGTRLSDRKQRPVRRTRLVETVVEALGQPGVGVVALALRGVAAEAPRRDDEWRRKKQQRGNEPNAARPDVHLPPRRC